MISKYDLRIGNMFEQGIVWKISGRAGAKVHLHGKGKWYKGFRSEVSVEHLKPIELGMDVIMNWCGFRDMEGCVFVCDDFALIYSKDGFTYNGKVILKYLHELQNLYYVLNKKELEIKG